MQATTRVFIFCLAAALPGCVSMHDYHALRRQNEKLQAQLDGSRRESGGLRNDLGQAQASNGELNQNKSALESQNGDLEQSEADLISQDTALTAQKTALERDNETLLTQAQEKQAQYDSVMGDLQKEVSDGLLTITRYKNRLTLGVADQILFDSAKASLKPDGKAVLIAVGKALLKTGKIICVMGNTDNVPLDKNAAYANNWELSTARATTVVIFLQDRCGLDPTRLVAEGRGEWAPVAPNDSAENRQKNRRIEISLLDRAMVDSSDGLSSTAAAR